MSDVEVIASREIRNSRDVKSSSRSSVEQRSRNKSIEKKPHKKSSRSLSRSRSQSRRSASRESSKSGKDRNDITRDNPVPCKCLGVFGLSLYTKERDLKDMFRKCGPIDHCTIVYDRRTGRSRGFGFVRFRHQDDADEARELMNGKEFDSHEIHLGHLGMMIVEIVDAIVDLDLLVVERAQDQDLVPMIVVDNKINT
ncbi:hypothetical protein HZS_6014 [Henneguya salminicola]|nr:hypothetical protein HZS_6014 [Henneguya salminicola]